MAVTLVDSGSKEEARALREELAAAATMAAARLAPATVAATMLMAAVTVAEASQGMAEVVEVVADGAVVAHLAAAEVSGAVEWRAAGWREAVHVEDESVAETRVAVFVVAGRAEAQAAWSCRLGTHSRRHQG